MNQGPHAITPVVSVIMPTWNGERFLRHAIDSILNQTFTDLELIVIDDASTDSTPRILADFHDTRLVVLTNAQNLGIAGATNRGLAAARGEYIALQDHDDISLPHRFQTQLDFLESNPEVAVLGSAATLIDDDGIPYAEFPVPCEEIDIKWRLLFVGDAFHYSSVMVRRNALLEIGGYSEDPAFRYSEAYDPFSRLAMRHRVANLPDRLLLWRRHPGATSSQHAQTQILSGEAISLRNISMLSDQTHDGACDRQYLFAGLKAFTSTPAGELPAVPAKQVLSGFKFCSDIQENFYQVHKFSKFDMARHRKSLTWTWGKHAAALAIRASWDWGSRAHCLMLGVRCLRHAAWATVLTSLAEVTGHGNVRPNLTVPTIRPFRGTPEQATWIKQQLNVR